VGSFSYLTVITPLLSWMSSALIPLIVNNLHVLHIHKTDGNT